MTAPTFAAQLAAFRTKRRLNQNQLAHACGYDHSYLSRLEAGKREPSRATVNMLACALRLDRWDAAGLYRAAGFWPPSLAAAAWLALYELEDRAGEPFAARQSMNDGIWDAYARLEDAPCRPS